MTYESLRDSVESSRPIELYVFSYQGGTFRYTSADRDIEFGSELYAHAPLSHTPVDETNEIGRQPVTITSGQQDFEVSELFNFAPPDDVVSVKITKIEAADMVTEKGVWIGRILSVDWPGDKAQMKCENILSSVKQAGLRRTYSKNCPHVLYEQGFRKCNAVRLDHEFTASLLSIVGVNLEATVFSTQPDTYFEGGYVEWEYESGKFRRRSIKTHIGSNIVVTHPIRGLTATMTIKAYPGCDHTWTGANGCVAKFANGDNYGAFPQFMGKNAFGNSSVF